MNGKEVKRFKNGKDKEHVREVAFFYHPCKEGRMGEWESLVSLHMLGEGYGNGTVLFHTGKSELGTFIVPGSGGGSESKIEKINTSAMTDLKTN